MSSRKIEDLHPSLQPICREFLKRAEDQGIDVLITCTYRSGEEQNKLYEQGRTTPGSIVTNARAGQSAHNFAEGGRPAAKAFDVVPMEHGKPVWDIGSPLWRQLGDIGVELGLKWYGLPGSKFREFPHFEMKEET